MKLYQLFRNPFTRHQADRKFSEKSPQSILQHGQDIMALSSRRSQCGCPQERSEAIDWELRPGGMLVQRRGAMEITPSLGPLIKVKVSHGLSQHGITIPSYATFGDLKWVLAQEVGLQPHEQRLIFQGKEKDDNEFLHIAGLKDMAKVILVEDPASKERKLQEVKSNQTVGKACQALAHVRAQVDKLGKQISALNEVLISGNKVADHDFDGLTELLMKQLLELDTIHAEGEAKVQRRIEVRRVQSFAEHLDSLKVQYGNPICSNVEQICTHWGRLELGPGGWSPPSSAQATVTTNWEIF